jgi:hypothetical protein
VTRSERLASAELIYDGVVMYIAGELRLTSGLQARKQGAQAAVLHGDRFFANSSA